jgi:DNA-binding response OmpR family regulator
MALRESSTPYGGVLDAAQADAPLDALTSVWERITFRIEDLLAPVEQLTTELLDGPPDPGALDRAIRAVDELASWVADLGMVAAARLARSLRRHLLASAEASEADVSAAVTAAGLIEDLRSSIDTTGTGGTSADDVGDAVLVVGSPGTLVDSLIWFGATTGFTIHHADQLSEWPSAPSAVVIVDDDAQDAASVVLTCRSARERFGDAPVVCVTHRTVPEDRAGLAWFSASLLASSLRPADVMDEVRRHLHISRRTELLAVRGVDAVRVAEMIDRRGLETWSSSDDTELLAGLEGGRASGVLLLPSEDNAELVRLLRAQPATRRLVIIEVLSGDTAASHAGVDATIESNEAIPHSVTQLAELLRQRSDLDVDLTPTTRTGGVPWSSASFLAERVLLGAHRADSVASVCVIRYDDDEPVSDVDAVQEALMREFRTDDVVTRSGDRENILVLGGVDRLISRNRLESIVDRSSTAGSRVGIAEFPFNARSVDDLVSEARAALDRSEGSGLRVITADWFPDRSSIADVVIADSDPASAHVVSEALGRCGLVVEHVADGQLLLERLRDPSIEPPRLLLLEFDLLSVDGLTILRRLHQQGAVRRFDIAMLSSRTRESDIRQAYDLGVAEVIQKPFSPGILARRLLRLIEAEA